MNPTGVDAVSGTSTSRPSANSALMLRLRIGTGVDALDFKMFSNDPHLSRYYIQQINGLIPSRYRLPKKTFRTAIGRAIAGALTYVNETCPPALRLDKLPHGCDWPGKCRIIASLIPVSYFPSLGEVTHRFYHGLIRYLQDTQAKGHILHPNTPSTNPPPGSDQTSAIKIESEDEGQSARSPGKTKGRRKSNKRKRHSEVSANAAPQNERNAAHHNKRTKPPSMGQNGPIIPDPVVEVTARRPDVDAITEQLREGLEVSPAMGRTPETSGHESSEEESQTESETSSEKESEYEDIRPSFESAAEVSEPRRPKPKKKPLNVYQAMFEEAQEEIRFLTDLLTKGAGLTEADLKAAKVRVKNKMGFKYAFESVFNKEQEKEQPTRARKPPRKKKRVTI